ncbi:hypothetical protein [Hyphomicrobium facile]|uniref:Peptidase propeptide and YPEB domain-containing protein n=1 Tax=Hyphomicrobium facile TaxID=51670 RepID=A0A1I7MY53_9HYPH|nr:hypothetical protein [Hyphomicrobium facile]SFV27298.1 hypothetical protein SAMN04488557_0726 [Hyphomicrobium facile]
MAQSHYFAAALLFGVGVVATNASAAGLAASDLAAQVRTQGFTCDKPQGAEKNDSASRPNEEVWILTCENGSYRMTVVPDMAAKIEKLDK